MLKYAYSSITCEEVPDKISITISLYGCPNKCKNCHSKDLWEDKGVPLLDVLDQILQQYGKYANCVCFMGGEWDQEDLEKAINIIKENNNLSICLYTGANNITDIKKEIIDKLDYIKLGPYIEELGGLDKETTNQRFYKIRKLNIDKNDWIELSDITFKFRKKYFEE